jgi:hypothetical protein
MFVSFPLPKLYTAFSEGSRRWYTIIIPGSRNLPQCCRIKLIGYCDKIIPDFLQWVAGIDDLDWDKDYRNKDLGPKFFDEREKGGARFVIHMRPNTAFKDPPEEYGAWFAPVLPNCTSTKDKGMVGFHRVRG